MSIIIFIKERMLFLIVNLIMFLLIGILNESSRSTNKYNIHIVLNMVWTINNIYVFRVY